MIVGQPGDPAGQGSWVDPLKMVKMAHDMAAATLIVIRMYRYIGDITAPATADQNLCTKLLCPVKHRHAQRRITACREYSRGQARRASANDNNMRMSPFHLPSS